MLLIVVIENGVSNIYSSFPVILKNSDTLLSMSDNCLVSDLITFIYFKQNKTIIYYVVLLQKFLYLKCIHSIYDYKCIHSIYDYFNVTRENIIADYARYVFQKHFSDFNYLKNNQITKLKYIIEIHYSYVLYGK